MAETTDISWADATFNPWIGCMRISTGEKGACENCYAAELMDTRYKRVTFGGPGIGVGTRERTSAENWKKPLAWDRKAARDGTRPFVFCASLADVFDNAVDPEWRRDLFDLIKATPNLVWLLLTKRPGNIRKMLEELADFPNSPMTWLPRNVALGCTVVTQEEASRDVPILMAAKRVLDPLFIFLSMEPLMERVDLTKLGDVTFKVNALTGEGEHLLGMKAKIGGVDWVIAGFESGPRARPGDPAFVRPLRDQCEAAGVPFQFKQWGAWHADAKRFTDTQGRCPPPDMKVGPKKAGRTLDGRLHDARPIITRAVAKAA